MTIEGRSDGIHGGRIRLGMVGGGQGAFIGAVHRIAARMDDQYVLVAGALSSDPQRARASGEELGLKPERIYADYRVMAKEEARRNDGIEAVSIVTPNHLHFPVSKAFMEAGIHVICDKPLVHTSREAKALMALEKKSGVIFALTHNYSGYPMIRQAREMVEAGALGTIQVIQAEYPQDWLTTKLEDEGHKQAGWRTDPERSGIGGCIGDIGTHAYQLACFVSGLELDSLSADLSTFVKGRKVDDNVHILLRFTGGARGMLWASQVAPGNENGLRLRVYGTKGGIDWTQADPNYLWYTPFGKPKQLITRGGAGSGRAAGRVTRVPPGHPEGYLEGFANIYMEVARAIKARRERRKSLDRDVTFPGLEDGAKGVAFIEAAVKSSKANGRWIKV
jgi:predicted dehydrogenase